MSLLFLLSTALALTTNPLNACNPDTPFDASETFSLVTPDNLALAVIPGADFDMPSQLLCDYNNLLLTDMTSQVFATGDIYSNDRSLLAVFLNNGTNRGFYPLQYNTENNGIIANCPETTDIYWEVSLDGTTDKNLTVTPYFMGAKLTLYVSTVPNIITLLGCKRYALSPYKLNSEYWEPSEFIGYNSG